MLFITLFTATASSLLPVLVASSSILEVELSDSSLWMLGLLVPGKKHYSTRRGRRFEPGISPP